MFFRHVWCSSPNHINWELVTAFDNDKLESDIDRESKQDPKITDKEKVELARKHFDELITSRKYMPKDTSENESNENMLSLLNSLEEVSFVLVEGITILNHVPTSNLCNLKFFLTLDYETCSKRRALRRYDPPDVDGYFQQVVWPEYEKLWAKIQLKEDKNVRSFY